MIRRPPRSTQSRSSAASDVYKRQIVVCPLAPDTRYYRPHRSCPEMTLSVRKNTTSTLQNTRARVLSDRRLDLFQKLLFLRLELFLRQDTLVLELSESLDLLNGRFLEGRISPASLPQILHQVLSLLLQVSRQLAHVTAGLRSSLLHLFHPP